MNSRPHRYLNIPDCKAVLRGGLAALAFIALAVLGARERAAQSSASVPIEATMQTDRNLGKAYYEQGKYKHAAAEFRRVVASGRAVALDHLDLAQALIQTNNLNEALEELTTAEEMAPHLLAVQYNFGLLYKHELRYPQAEAALRRVAAADPGDPATWFNIGTVLFNEHQFQKALGAFERVVRMGYARAQNFYVAATFRCFIILSRLKQPEAARKYLKLNMATRNRVPGVSLQNSALEAGKYGKVEIASAPLTWPPLEPGWREVEFRNITGRLGIDLPKVTPPSPSWRDDIPAGNLSLPAERRKLASLFGGSVAVGDYDGDGRPDLYVVVPGGKNHLLHNNGNGTFTDVTAQAGVAGDGGSLSAAFVDYNNSGRESLVVAGLGGLTLYKNNGNGTFSNVTAKAGLKVNQDELDTDVIAFDTDNDGFVDLVATAYTDFPKVAAGRSLSFPRDFPPGVVHLYRNNGDGTFSDIAARSGLGIARGHLRGAVFADFNNDGYADLLFFRDDGPPLLFLNHGMDKFTDATAQAGVALGESRALGGAVSDFNHDGWFDLALWTRSGYEVLLNRGGGRFKAVRGLPRIPPPRSLFARRGALADLNGDSFDDLLIKDAEGGWCAVINHAGRFTAGRLGFAAGGPHASAASTLLGVASTLQPLWLSSPGDLDLLSLLPDGRLAAFERQGPPARWIEVRFSGFKSNKQGVGDVVELKAGNFYDKVQAKDGGSIRIFTGNLPKLDVVRVTWPNQVVQNSIHVATDTSVEVRESEKLASSCPFLYVWNGRRFVFFTDILGASPLGELAPDGTYLRPDPEEYVRLGSGLKLLNGNYVFHITDEMREVDYIDRLQLLAVDHPADESVYSNEIYSPQPAPPSLYFVRHKRFPVSATDDHGTNVLPLIRYSDGRYPANFQRSRILGLASVHSLTLNLGAFPQAARVALWMRGWVFWTDSNASRALMTNRRLKMSDPYIQVRNMAGKWVTVVPDAGLPSGTNRTMRVDLTGKFPTSDHHIRIVTNLCVYWDQIFFTTDESAARPSFVLPLDAADLHYRGFSEETSDRSHTHPDTFDYVRLMKAAPWNPARGPYTRYGPVRSLLLRADNELVAMSSGDDITVRFSARRLPPLPAGWKRDFFLDVTGYAKDGEPNTAFARSVRPLPFLGMPGYPPSRGQHPPASLSYQRYLREYETRPAYDLIPPLAPPAP